MKHLHLTSLLTAFTISTSTATTATTSEKAKTLHYGNPIYIGDVFYPPSLHIIAWTASNTSASSETSVDSHVTSNGDLRSPDWCRMAMEIGDGGGFSLFSEAVSRSDSGDVRGDKKDGDFGEKEGDKSGNKERKEKEVKITFHNYFSEEAYLEREGKRWGKCHITPESGDVGGCKGEEGDRWVGRGIRTWSCWGEGM